MNINEDHKTLNSNLYNNINVATTNASAVVAVAEHHVDDNKNQTHSVAWNGRCSGRQIFVCEEGRMTRTRRLPVNIFAAHKLLHVLLFILCISRTRYVAGVGRCAQLYDILIHMYPSQSVFHIFIIVHHEAYLCAISLAWHGMA